MVGGRWWWEDRGRNNVEGKKVEGKIVEWKMGERRWERILVEAKMVDGKMVQGRWAREGGVGERWRRRLWRGKMMEENLCSLLCVLLRQQRGAGEGWNKSMGGEWIRRHDLSRTRQRRVNVPLDGPSLEAALGSFASPLVIHISQVSFCSSPGVILMKFAPDVSHQSGFQSLLLDDGKLIPRDSPLTPAAH